MTESAQWWKRGVIYQIYPRSFQDSNGDGIGDLPGITSRLDYLQWLGVDAIWLSPIYKSPMADFGYDVSDYTAIDPIFGTMDDFDELVKQAHARGIKVVMDFVPNHTSNQHPWFIESRSSRDNPKRDWYIWVDPAPGGGPPNNWLAYFGGAAWTFDEKTGQYYLHNFLPEQPDLNYRNPEVKKAVLNDIRFWLDRGVDGFRVDVIDRMMKDPQLRDNPPNPTFVQGRDNPTFALQRKYSEGGPGIHDLLRDFQAVFKSYDDRVSIGEIQYYADPEQMMPYYGEDESDEMDLPFNFGLILMPWTRDAIRDFVERYEEVLPPFAWPNYVLGNHDQQRLASRVGEQQVRVAAMLLLTLRGTPFVYNGDELGMPNGNIPQDRVRDPQGINIPGYTRDVTRTPLLWNNGPYAGFSTVEPWLPLNENIEKLNVESQRQDERSVLHLYHRLIGYRRETVALELGNYITVDFTEADVYAYTRQHGTQQRLIVLNFSDAAKTLDLSNVAERGQVVISTELDREEEVALNALSLRPNEGLLIEL